MVWSPAMFPKMNRLLLLRSFSSSPSSIPRNPLSPAVIEAAFLTPSVQSLLKQLVGFDPSIIFSPKPVPKLAAPRYVFMTDEDVNVSMDRANKHGRKRVQLVPYKSPRDEEVTQILSKDPELQGYETCNIVFTDISMGASDQTRLIAVREPNGILRRATRDERYRMNQVYYPKAERMHYVPRMFDDEHLKDILERGDYLFVLDRACLQFEPDDPVYHRVLEKTFSHMNQRSIFKPLYSNRHFGSLIFHLCLKQDIDNLLIFLLEGDHHQEASWLVSLYYNIHVDLKEQFDDLGSHQLKQLKFFLENDSRKKHVLELTIQSVQQRMEPTGDKMTSS